MSSRPRITRPVPRPAPRRGSASRSAPPPQPAASIPSLGLGTQGVTAPTYPGALDSPPTLQEGVSPLAAIWWNYVGAVLEAIEAEIGAFPSPNPADPTAWVAGYPSLMDMLEGIQVLQAGSPKLIGVSKVSVTKAGSGYNAVGNFTHTAPAKPNAKRPVVFATPRIAAASYSDLDNCPGKVLARGTWITGTSIFVEYRGMAVAGQGVSGSPTSASSYTTDFLLFFMPEA